MTEQTRKCTQCDEEKPFSAFYKNKSKRFGIASECKVCATEAKNERKRRKEAEALKKDIVFKKERRELLVRVHQERLKRQQTKLRKPTKKKKNKTFFLPPSRTADENIDTFHNPETFY